MKQNTAPANKNNPNATALERTIEQMEYDLSNASFGGDRSKIPLLLKQLKEARRIHALVSEKCKQS